MSGSVSYRCGWLDGRITLKLEAAGQLGKLLSPGWRSLQQIEATASVAGSVAARAFDDISANIRGPGDSRMRLAGSLRAIIPGGMRLERVDLTSNLEIPRIDSLAELFDFAGAGLERF